ncbi:MAG: hypothetical protein ACKN81_11345 [Pirellulaceae bacterium]
MIHGIIAMMVLIMLPGMDRRADAAVELFLGNFSPQNPSYGTAGNTFDIMIRNSVAGPAVSIQYFSFQLEVDPIVGLLFTGVERTPAATYIFGAYNPPSPPADLFSLDPFPNTMFVASDPVTLPPPPAPTVLNPGDTYTLGRVTYSVDLQSDEFIWVRFGVAGTSLSSDLGDPISFTSTDSQLYVVPEPSTLAITVVGMLVLRRGRARRLVTKSSAIECWKGFIHAVEAV